jgi:hypothetical protein
MKKLKQLKKHHATLLEEAAKFRTADGQFADDAARASFDAKMVEADKVQAQIRTLEAAEDDEPLPVQTDTVTAEQRSAIIAAEQTRVTGIQTAVRVAGLDAALATDMVTRNLTIDAARAEIFEKLAARSTQQAVGGHHQVIGVADEHDKFLRGALNWLIVRSGLAALVAQADKVDVKTIDPGEFRGMSLVDLARTTLERAGRSFRGFDKMNLVSEAFMLRATQSTSDFTTLLENTMNKVLQAQYSITPDTWRKFCNTSSNPDFRAANRYRWGNLSVLDSLSQTGEFLNKGLSDAEKATLTLATKGNIINLSRQMIVNDDMGAFTRLPMMLGRAAALSIEVDVYALLAQNAGLGPTLSDGLTLFHATHLNLTTGAALAAAALDLDRVAMASQKEPNGNDFIDLRPAILVLPVGLGGAAKVINQSQYDPDTIANKSQMKPNIVVGLFREIVDSPRVTAISSTRRYLFADPSIAPVLEVAFLEGQDAPVMETKDGWRTDGAEMKVRFDYVAGAVDFRGAVTNAGV